jgi:hypothetical protein
MSMSKHTPGPWRPVTDGISHWVEIDGIIAMVMNCRHKQAQSKAALIAAAPELLEALKVALDASWDGPMPDYARDKACAAIAKATGEDEV